MYAMTRFPYIHCGILFDNGFVCHAEMNGSRVRVEPKNKRFPAKDTIEVPIPCECNQKAMWEWCLQKNGKLYDWANVIQWSMFGNTINTKEAYTCTELCLEVMKVGGCLPTEFQHSPINHVLPEELYNALLTY